MGEVIVLTLNNGSSSLKFGVYSVGVFELDMLMTGEIEKQTLQAQDARGAPLKTTPQHVGSTDASIGAIAGLIKNADLPTPEAVGHRIVHGGPKLRDHCLIDEGVERDLEAACVLSPLHGPAALALIRHARDTWPGTAQVACFDTAFHATMPERARALPVSWELRALGVQRYGFHGLSCESIIKQLGAACPNRVIIAHLGSGSSVTAVLNGRSVDTSMGLTPSGGVIMAERSGDLDPGILIYLAREHGFDAAMLEKMIDHRSGLLGISALSGDLRDLHAAQPENAQAELAIEMFCISIAKAIAGMIVVLGGVDAIVFTGGVGENDAIARLMISRNLRGLGFIFVEGCDATATQDSVTSTNCRVLQVLPAREDEQIAQHTQHLSIGHI